MALYDSTLVFEHERGQEQPFIWTAIHVVFVVMLIGTIVMNWIAFEGQAKKTAALIEEQNRNLDEQARLSAEQTRLASEQAVMAQENAELVEDAERRLQVQRQTADEVAVTCAELSARSSDACSSVDQSSEASGSMASFLGQVDDAVRQVAGLTRDAGVAAGNTEEGVDQLVELSQKIDQMVALIAEISERSNLLALNASVEAARAGEAGRGFAVVAGEVKELANSTGDAAREIGALTDEIRAGVGRSKTNVTEVAEIVATISGLQTTLEQDMDEQRAQVETVQRSANNASTMMQEVIGGIQELNSLLDNPGSEDDAPILTWTGSETLVDA